MSGYDVAVVGAGVVGSGIAHACASRGARVLLLDRGEPGSQASGAAAGMLAPLSEAHGGGPFLDLARDSLRRWPELAARLLEESGVDPELSLTGLLRVAVDDAAATEVRSRLDWQRQAGIEGRWLDAVEVRRVEPALAGAAGAAWYPEEGHVHSPRAVRAMVEAARRRGVDVRSGAEVVAPAHGGGMATLDGTVLHAGAWVVAAGAWSARAATAFGAPPLPVRPVRGQLIAVRGLPRLPEHVLFAGLAGYAVAKRDGLVLVGATEEDAGFDARVTVAATQQLLGTATRLLHDVASATLAYAWAGLRPRSPDALPLLGRLPGADPALPVYVAAGHHRNGVLLAPATAAGMAAMVLDGVTPPGWAAFDPARFG